jgi:hypothetical protein
LSIRLVSLRIFINRNSIVVASHVDFLTSGSLLRIKDRTWPNRSFVLGWFWSHSTKADRGLLLSLW